MLENLYINTAPGRGNQEHLAEKSVTQKLPSDYSDVFALLGPGSFDSFLILPSPDELLLLNQNWNAFIHESGWDFWDLPSGFSKDINEYYCFASSIDGDYFVFRATGRVYCLPRHDSGIHECGSTIESTLEWTFSSGTLVEPTGVRYFQPSSADQLLELNGAGEYPSLERFRSSIIEAIGTPDFELTDKKCTDLFHREFESHFNCWPEARQCSVSFNGTTSSDFRSLIESTVNTIGLRAVVP